MGRFGGIKRTAADVWFSKVVRARANHVCEYCQKREAQECAHIFSRRHAVTRWTLDNALGLCHYCHQSTGQEPIEFHDFIEARWPGRLDRLRVLRTGFLKNNDVVRKAVSKHYRDQFKAWEEGNLSTEDFESWN